MTKKINFKDGENVILSAGGEIARVQAWGKAHMEAEVLAGRVNVTSLPVVSAPVGDIRHRSDGKVTIDLLDEDNPGEIVGYLADGRKVLLAAVPREQKRGWGAGEFYMLPVDANDRVIYEPGENHRKVYISASPQAMDKAAIAAHAGVSTSAVTASWLDANRQYGGSESMPVTEDVGLMIFDSRVGSGKPPCSDWYLYERGYSYGKIPAAFLMRGESELHPLVISAWGSGDQPHLSSSYELSGYGPKFLVVQNVRLDGFKFVEGYCVIFDGYSIVQHEASAGRSKMITIRNGRHNDCWLTAPKLAIDGEVWEPSANRFGGFYCSDTRGLLIDACLFDHGGWAEGYDYNLSVNYPHPPSGLSHNIYLAHHAFDVTMRDSISSRGASFGAMYRGGATVDNVLFLDNNIALNTLGGNYKDRGPIGEYSTIRDSVCTSSGYKRHASSVVTSQGTEVNGRSGAYDWGMDSAGVRTSIIGNIICHRANPADPDEQAAKPGGGMAFKALNGAISENNIVYRWNGTDENTTGLSVSAMDQTTIQNYASQLLGSPGATIDDFNLYARDPDVAIRPLARDCLDYFRAGFGLDQPVRTTATECVFLPDPRGEGFRWDNRLNWSTGDLPGSVAGDTAALDGNPVRFGGLTTDVASIRFDGGEIDVTSGRLTIGSVQDAASVKVRNSGQIFIGASTAPIAAIARNGRLSLTGTVADLDLVAGGKAQVLLGPDCTVPAGKKLAVHGMLAKVGWDGTGTANLRIEGALEFTPGTRITVPGARTERLYEGVTVTGQTSGFTATASYYDKFATGGNNVLWLDNVQGTPQVGEDIHYGTIIDEGDGYRSDPSQVTITDMITILEAIEEVSMPKIAPFRSGMHGLAEPTVTASLTLASGSTVFVDTTGLASGTYDLTGPGVTVTDNGATLPAGVTVTGGRLVYTKA